MYRFFAALLVATTFSVPQARAAPIACTSSESGVARAATTKAREMLLKVSKLAEDEDPIAVERMTLWLGVNNSAQAKAVRVRLSSAWAWLGGVTFLCDASDPAYAWVYSGQPFLIRLGKSFSAASDSGYSSKPGTLIHEVTHFLIAGASKDPPKRDLYGTVEALKRAKSDPGAAQINAENLEYFVEATFHGLTPP